MSGSEQSSRGFSLEPMTHVELREEQLWVWPWTHDTCQAKVGQSWVQDWTHGIH